MYWVYILKCSDDTLYTWVTNDLEKRLHQHNNTSQWAKYTKARRPLEIVYSKTYPNKSKAMKVEYRIKQLRRKQKQDLIQSDMKLEQFLSRK